MFFLTCLSSSIYSGRSNVNFRHGSIIKPKGSFGTSKRSGSVMVWSGCFFGVIGCLMKHHELGSPTRVTDMDNCHSSAASNNCLFSSNGRAGDS